MFDRLFIFTELLNAFLDKLLCYLSAFSITKAPHPVSFCGDGQEAAVANMIAAAIASSRQEPVSNIPPLNVAPPVHEEITGSIDPSPSLGAIPLNQSSRTEATEQIVVASRADEHEVCCGSKCSLSICFLYILILPYASL